MSSLKKDRESIYDAIYDVVRCVPKGRVTSYGAVAAAIGAKSGARVVGYAMNNCLNAKPKVPAHRVVNRQGLLTGKMHFSDPDEMERRLAAEGIKVENDRVKDFKTVYWNPVEELLL